MTQPVSPYRFWAFLSYSRADARISEKLYESLERFRIPSDLVGRPGRHEPLPHRLFPIFRDRDELPLTPDLGTSIREALRDSRALIVVCSPAAARSQWVNEEVRYFKSLGRSDRIFAIIVHGEPTSRADDADQCFPPALRYQVEDDGRLGETRSEPAAGDLRPGGDGWRGVLVKAASGITGLGYDAFAKRERRRRRRALATRAAIGLVVSLLGLGVWDRLFRTKVRYFANWTERWGVPSGVGELAIISLLHARGI